MSITRARCLTAIVAIGLLGASVTLLAQGKKLTTTEAEDHIGEQATVGGKVAGGATTRGKPTFRDLDRPYEGRGCALANPTVPAAGIVATICAR